MIVLHIPDIRAIRLFVSFVIPYADFITNFNRLFWLSGIFRDREPGALSN